MNALRSIPHGITPEEARAELLICYGLLDWIEQTRGKADSKVLGLRPMLVLAALRDEVEEEVAMWRRWLSRVARRGGRGTPTGAGRSPASREAASKGHGRPAFAGDSGAGSNSAEALVRAKPDAGYAVGTATTTPKARLGGSCKPAFSCPVGQTLPAGAAGGYVNTSQGATSDA